MLRIHLTGVDLGRTVIADTPDPLWETVLSLHVLRAGYGRIAFAEWRQQVRAGLRRHGLSERLRKWAPVAPPASYFPDFLTPPEGLAGLEPGLDAVLATDPRRIRAELGLLHDRVGTPAWAWELADRSAHARTELVDTLSSYYRVALARYWPALCDRAAADRAARVRLRREGGIDALLHSFRPAVRWHPPVLEIDRPVDRDLYLEGRGLVLVPSQFCWTGPITLVDPALPPTLVYPLEHHPRWTAGPGRDQSGQPLGRLLGATRAQVLHAATIGPNTTEIARRLGIAPATVSQHTAVLREAGLLTSTRHENNVLHLVTALGLALLGQPALGQRRTCSAQLHPRQVPQ